MEYDSGPLPRYTPWRYRVLVLGRGVDTRRPVNEEYRFPGGVDGLLEAYRTFVSLLSRASYVTVRLMSIAGNVMDSSDMSHVVAPNGICYPPRLKDPPE